MALIKIQQSQMSGTLAGDVDDRVTDLLAGNRTLADDLNALRTQIRVIQGTGAWTDTLSGTQDLAEIYAAMHADGTDASFQGEVNVATDLFVSGAAEVSGTVTSFGGFSGSLTKLSDGSDYILEGKNISTVTGALGSVEIIANPGAVENGVQYNVDGYFTADNTFTFEVGADSNQNDMGKLSVSGSVSFGSGSLALGEYSRAEGRNTQAAGKYSSTAGENTQAGINGFFGYINDAGKLVIEGDHVSYFTENPGVKLWPLSTDGWELSSTSEEYLSNPTLVDGYTEFDISSNWPTGGMRILSYNTVNHILPYEGRNPNAFNGEKAQASGMSSVAIGNSSIAHGEMSLAAGDYSYAHGSNVVAIGAHSHAEGYYSKAIGEHSHAEGWSTIAYGDKSHAEGGVSQTGFKYLIPTAYDVLNETYPYNHFTVQGKVSGYSNHKVFYIDGLNLKYLGDFSSGTFTYDSENDVTIVQTSCELTQGQKNNIQNVKISFPREMTMGNEYVQSESSSYSHAEGYGTIAGSDASHAEGNSTNALGSYSHAEGNGTYATGGSSHAEGDGTFSYGPGSHAEGKSSISIGNSSHAEGSGSVTYGIYSHAEGEGTITYAMSSHSEGLQTWAAGTNSHAEGGQSKAWAVNSHAEGSGSNAGASSIIANINAEGNITVFLSGTAASYFPSGSTVYFGNMGMNWDYWDVEGNNLSSFVIDSLSYNSETGVTTITPASPLGLVEETMINMIFPDQNNIADISYLQFDSAHIGGAGSHAEGYSARALRSYSHAEGVLTTTMGFGSHAEGSGSVAFGMYSHAEGQDTLASGSMSHAEGLQTEASGEAAHSEGWAALASGDHSHAEGYGTEASGVGAHAEGSGSVAFGMYSHAEGEVTFASGAFSHAEGEYTIASGSHSHAEGYGTIARGQWSHAAGSGSFANGEGSHAEGKLTTADGDYAFAGGFATQATGDASFAFGSGSVALSNFSFAVGEGTVASGSAQFIAGAYNKHLNPDSIFVIGNGTDDANRSDIFIVNPDLVMVGSGNVGSDVFFYVGTHNSADTALFDAEVYASGTVSALGGFTGSLTKLMDGSDYLRAGVGISLATGSSGEVTISANSNSVAKGNFAGDAAEIDTDTNILDFSGIGELAVADWKHIDVYLNGAYLSYGAGRDLSDVTETSIKIDAAIIDSLVAEDIITVTLRNIV